MKPRKVPNPLTRADARKAIRWFQKRMGIQDWRLRLWIQDSAPDWVGKVDGGTVGMARRWEHSKRAKIWVSASQCDDEDEALSILFHEGMHIVGLDIGIENADREDRIEFAWNQIGDLMAEAYRAGI